MTQDNKKYGFILFYRSIRNHWLWSNSKDSPIKRFMDILLEASHKDRVEKVGSVNINLQRGQFIRSYGFWAKRWGIDRSNVSRFFKRLETDKIAHTKLHTISHRSYVLVTIINYDLYQSMIDLSAHKVAHKVATFSKELEVIKQKHESGFKKFWDKYHELTGLPKSDKQQAHKYWMKLEEKEMVDAYTAIEGYVRSVEETYKLKRYCKKARTYLSAKEWQSVQDQGKKVVKLG